MKREDTVEQVLTSKIQLFHEDLVEMAKKHFPTIFADLSEKDEITFMVDVYSSGPFEIEGKDPLVMTIRRKFRSIEKVKK